MQASVATLRRGGWLAYSFGLYHVAECVLRLYTCRPFLHHTATVIAQAECEEQSLCRDCITLPECTWCSDNTVRTGPKLLVCLPLLHTPFRHAYM